MAATKGKEGGFAIGMWFYMHVQTLSQDDCLRRLGNALRAAHLHGFTNGLAKAVLWRMVVDEGICEKHQLRMYV